MAPRISTTSPAINSTIARAPQDVVDHRLHPRAETRRRRHHARARERHVLPGPGLALLIGGEAADLGGERAGAAGRTQPHVDLVERAVIGLRGQRVDQPLRQPSEILRAIERTFSVRFRMLAVEVVDQDQVEIGASGHLAAAELAHGQHRSRLAAHVAVRRREIIGDRAMHGSDHRVGEPRESLARLPRRHRAGQDAHADQKHIFQPEHADAFEQVLVVARLRQRRVEPPAEFRLVRQGAEKARIDQRIHHLRIARQRIGEPGRDAEHQRDQRNEIGVLPQQRQQPRGAMQIGEKLIEQHQRGVGDCRCARSAP